MSAAPHRRSRILIVDDHPILRAGVRQMLASEPDLDVCGEGDSVTSGKQLVTRTQPDLVILDLSLSEGTGLEFVRWLRDSWPMLPALVFSVHDEVLFAERVLRSGARGYVMKREAVSGLVAAIRQVLAGRIYVSEALAQAMLERLRQGAVPNNPLASLTDKELEVFDWIGRGLSTGAIADQLKVSIKTIETYRSHIRAKLNLKDANDLVRFATAWTERL